MTGRVQYGDQIGRTLNFPTINVRMNRHKPCLNGIYAHRHRPCSRAAEEVEGIIETEAIASTQRFFHAIGSGIDGATGLLFVQPEFADELRKRLGFGGWR